VHHGEPDDKVLRDGFSALSILVTTPREKRFANLEGIDGGVIAAANRISCG